MSALRNRRSPLGVVITGNSPWSAQRLTVLGDTPKNVAASTSVSSSSSVLPPPEVEQALRRRGFVVTGLPGESLTAAGVADVLTKVHAVWPC